ncbi:transcription antitermination factor NusB [Tanticharoenia sakaeratensis]|jgi:transcription antitermination protein NusB|uniref:Transcription antitermination protein NusB n=1 Tax=Tanticharoenia sakaeratensis NBRC 103193 TaxID=1231623 RepID=A0A0D6MIZ5_9PROT|nr:transcription antitermination factor NusB [Tanticharoenia sakaeratensis]GAN53425.1 NusB family protein [Tanticharoenia sakaeratensis NBRC 103193]GBQ20693.1 transcription antitermination factor NusB [Tanticharoenia sakaeratensis NBRC 103193]
MTDSTAPGRPPKARSRTTARVAAVQALFQCEQAGETAETVADQFTRHRLGGTSTEDIDEGQMPDADFRLFGMIVRGTTVAQDRIDAELSGALPEAWPLHRLDPVLRALLRAAVFEFGSDTPPRVVINEYLDVAHGFFSGDEPKLVNGVLDALAKARALQTPDTDD